MALFARRDQVQEQSLWTDGMGRVGTRSAQLLLILTLLSVSVYVMLQLQLLVIPVLIALILAAAVYPVVNVLRRWGWSSALATATAFLGILVVLGGVITGIVVAVRNELDELISSATEGWAQLQGFLADFPLPVDQAQIDEALAGILDFLTSAAVGRSALSGLSTATQFITGAVLMAVVLFYFLKDGERIWTFLLRWFPYRRRAKMALAGSRAVDVLGNYVRGTAIVAAVDAIFIGLALLILQVPLALPLAVLIFIGGFVPIVGATVAGVLAALVALVANGPVAALVVIGVVVLVNQLEGNFLQPVVMGRSVSLHSLVILLALTAGTILGGIVGAILAVPVAAVAWAVIQVWTGDTKPEASGRRVRLEEKAVATVS
ncbi:AI-2E family transporter [Arthrobacter crystallopoietes]|uniref:Predicted PurR-regulated permease PerM n=1 Tax=Crystallibacter crystallopoietes TaxID=37928 RepID=A0A1H1FE92_9MICC|nr:AI-2E family transporter [Arthrobacter crystallopoietes]SDQ99227.1 Predicted PurR-regulated permease PerM [Arthrobacter crystallopoietes]